jgi:hypothetical protein
MKKVKLTFNISKNVAEMLEKRVPNRKLNAFIEEAIQFRFDMLEREKFLQELVLNNKVRDEELDKIEAGLEPEDALFQSDAPLIEDELSELDDLL